MPPAYPSTLDHTRRRGGHASSNAHACDFCPRGRNSIRDVGTTRGEGDERRAKVSCITRRPRRDARARQARVPSRPERKKMNPRVRVAAVERQLTHTQALYTASTPDVRIEAFRVVADPRVRPRREQGVRTDQEKASSAASFPTLFLHHGPTEFAVLSAAEAATSAAARNAKTAPAVIRRHHPSPGPSQYPAERSSIPPLRPATAHAAA